MPIHILLADDHTLFRSGLRHILEEHADFRIVAEASTGLQAVELARTKQPDVAVLDIGMKELSGLEAAPQILKHSARTSILMLSMHGDERYVAGALKAGARGYLLKDSVGAELIQAIRQVHRGGIYLSPRFVQNLRRQDASVPSTDPSGDRYALLTDREKQLYHLLAEGNSNKEIANRLQLSLHTVETHRTRIMDKMGMHGIAELVIDAVRRGFVLPY